MKTSDKPRLAAIGKGKGKGTGFKINSELNQAPKATSVKNVPASVTSQPEGRLVLESELDQAPTTDPHVGPHLIHDGTGSCCSECAQPVNIPTGTCAPCPHCGAQFGGCG